VLAWDRVRKDPKKKPSTEAARTREQLPGWVQEILEKKKNGKG